MFEQARLKNLTCPAQALTFPNSESTLRLAQDMDRGRVKKVKGAKEAPRDMAAKLQHAYNHKPRPAFKYKPHPKGRK